MSFGRISNDRALRGGVRDPVLPKRIGRIVLITFLVIVCGCSVSTAPSDTGPVPRPFPDEAAEIRHILESMYEMSSTDSDELAMAWDDLESDLISVSSDLETDALSTELDGVVRRVEGFRQRFQSSEAIGRLTSEWDDLVAKLTDVRDRLRS